MLQVEAEALARQAGLSLEYASVYEDRIVLNYTGFKLTFEVLEAISKAFGTNRIDLGVDRGCPSDPSMDPYLIVWMKKTEDLTARYKAALREIADGYEEGPDHDQVDYTAEECQEIARKALGE